MLENYILLSVRVLYLQFNLKVTSRGQKYGGFLSNCTKIPPIVLCWKSRQLAMWVDSKIKFLLQARIKKIKFYVHLANEEMGAATVDSHWLKIRRGSKQLLRYNTNLFKAKRFRVIEWDFAQKTSEILWFLECPKRGFAWSSIFWICKLLRVNCVYEFPIFFLQIYSTSSKNSWRDDFRSSFSSSIAVKIEASSKKCGLSKSPRKQNCRIKVHSMFNKGTFSMSE